MTISTAFPESPTVVPTTEPVPGVQIPTAAFYERARAVLTEDAIKFLATLHRQFEPERQHLLKGRAERQAVYDAGEAPTYLDRDSDAVTGNWKVAPPPADLQRRRVEITGPVNSRKIVIQMLSRDKNGVRADCAMLDFEDSMKPAWSNVIDGLHNVIGAAAGELVYEEPAGAGKPARTYSLNPDDMALLMVRARGLHLVESNFHVDGAPISAGLFDLGLCWLHTAKTLIARGKTPKYYIPKVEHYEEARWWNSVFNKLEATLNVPTGSLRATFLIETLPAAFQIEEILFELRDHAVALNVGRWDKIFSDIKTLKYHPDRVIADRATIGMNRAWMKNYAHRLVRICHARGAFALGGMAAFTPGRDVKTRAAQASKVGADKRWEFDLGHDGCWVSHPYFIGIAMEAFPRDNQLDVLPEPADKYPDLLPTSEGERTLAGLRTNIRVGIAYLEGWLRDVGCIAWDDLMEDLATLEISRAQVWQWLHHQVTLKDGTPVTPALVTRVFQEELDRILGERPPAASGDAWRKAHDTALNLFLQKDFQEFLSSAGEVM